MSTSAITLGSKLPTLKELNAEYQAGPPTLSRETALFKTAVAAQATGLVEFLVGATVGLGHRLPIVVLTEALFAAIFRNNEPMASALQNALPRTTPLVIKETLYALSLVLKGSPINQEALRHQLADRCRVIEGNPRRYLDTTTPQADRQRMFRVACEVSNLVVVDLTVCLVSKDFIELGINHIRSKRGGKDPVICILEKRLTCLKRESEGASVGKMPCPAGIDGSDPSFGLFEPMDDDHSSRVEHEAFLPPPPPVPLPSALEGIPVDTPPGDLPPPVATPCHSPSSLGEPSVGESSQASSVIPTPPAPANPSRPQPPGASVDRVVCDKGPIGFAAVKAVWESRPPIAPTATAAPSIRPSAKPASAPTRTAPASKKTHDLPPTLPEGIVSPSTVLNEYGFEVLDISPAEEKLPSPPPEIEKFVPITSILPAAAPVKSGWLPSWFSGKKG
jgi:hypothetical protein